MKVLDSHCHLQMSQYDHDREEVIARAKESEIGMLCVGVDRDSSEKAIKLAERHADLWASVGLHPNDDLDEVYDSSEYEELAKHPKVAAIGEIGLDYYRTKEKREYQKDRFIKQLDLVKQSRKPVIIHCRDAHDDMLELLTSQNYSGVIHSFNGTMRQAAAYIKEGFFIGLNAIITFSSEYEEMVRSIPEERLLLETDAPFLAPAPYRGGRNEPVYILETLRCIARIRALTEESLLTSSLRNSKELFSI